jgi:hypothetical protein
MSRDCKITVKTAVIRKYIRKYIRIESQHSTEKIPHNSRDGQNGLYYYEYETVNRNCAIPVQTCKHDVIKYSKY